MDTQKKRRGDRRDGRLLRELDSLHFITGILYPNRCDNEAYISLRVDLTAMNEYLARLNAEEKDVKLLDITDERTAAYYGLDRTGVYIQSVESGSIADLGGLQAGDCILTFGGETVSTTDELKEVLAGCAVGDRVAVTVERNGREYSHSLLLTEYVPDSARS